MYCDCFYDVIFNHAEGPTPVGQRWHEQNLQDSRGQRQLLDVVDTDQLSDAEATQMLQRFNAAEPGNRVQELDRGRGQTWTGHEPEKTLFIQQTERERQTGGGRKVEAERWRQTVRGVSVGYQGLWIAGSRGTFRSWSAWWLSLWTRPPSDNDPQTSDDTRDWTSLQRTDRNISCWLCSSIQNMNNWVRNCLILWLKKSKTQKTCRHESEWETTTPRVHFTVRQPITELHINGELKLKITLHQLIHFRPTIFHGYSSSGLWVM